MKSRIRSRWGRHEGGARVSCLQGVLRAPNPCVVATSMACGPSWQPFRQSDKLCQRCWVVFACLCVWVHFRRSDYACIAPTVGAHAAAQAFE